MVCSGTLLGQVTDYAQFAFTFTNATNPGCTSTGHGNCGVTVYDATVKNAYNGIAFDVIMPTLPNLGSNVNGSKAACSAINAMPLQVDLVDNQAVTDHYFAVPMTTSWQSVTVFFNQAINQGVVDDPTHLQVIKFAPMNEGTTVTGLGYSFTLNNIRLVQGTAPAMAVTNKYIITDFENGSNLIPWTGPTGISTPGAIYVAGGWNSSSGDTLPLPPGEPTADVLPGGDPLATVWNTCPISGAIGGSFFPATPGHNGLWAGHVMGTFGDETNPYIQLGINLQNPRNTTDLSGYSTLTFWAKAGVTPNAATPMIVKFPNEYTDPQGGVCNNSTYSAAGNGAMIVDGVADTNSNCANDHQVGFTLSTTWQQITVTLKSSGPNYPTQQAYWGEPGPGPDNLGTPVDFDGSNAATITGGDGRAPIATVYAVSFQTNVQSEECCDANATNCTPYGLPENQTCTAQGFASNGTPVDFWIDDVTLAP